MRIERGSDNVVTDLGLPGADPRLLKAELVTRIDKIIRQPSSRSRRRSCSGYLNPMCRACCGGASGSTPWSGFFAF